MSDYISREEPISPWLNKELNKLVNQPIVPTDELKRIIGYQDVISTTYQEIEVKSNE